MNSYNQLVQCWINRNEKLPDLCCICGVFTDKREKIKHQIYLEEQQTSDSLSVQCLRLFFFFLGPLGWLLALFIRKDREKRYTKVKKIRIPISLCTICKSEQQPQILETSDDSQKFLLLVHPEFQKRINTM